MPGGIAHIVLVNRLMEARMLSAIGGLSPERKYKLTRYATFCELGAVAPDYPYLARQNAWADAMHYRATGSVIHHAVAELRRWPEGDAKDKALAWLLGYAGHVGADIAIHPVVELKVGPYEANQLEHRLCEMHQDVWIWGQRQAGTLDDVNYLESGLATCSDAVGGLDDDVEALWQAMLKAAHPADYASNSPLFDLWHHGYTRLVQAAYNIGGRGGNPFVAMTRHLLDGKAVLYPDPDEVDDNYISGLAVPGGGRMHYGQVFDGAVRFVAGWWSAIGAALDAASTAQAHAALASVVDANLDQGILDGADAYVAWAPERRIPAELPV